MNEGEKDLDPTDKDFDTFLQQAETDGEQELFIAEFVKKFETKADTLSDRLGFKNSSDTKEIALITTIEAHAIGLEYQLSAGKITADQAASSKRQLIAEFFVIEAIEHDDPLLELIDELVPGGSIDIDSDDMQTYYVEAMEELANRVEEQREIEDLLARAYQAAGIDLDDIVPETSKTLLTIAKMIFLNQLPDSSPNSIANRQERLYETARKGGLDSLTTQKVIQFIETESPL